MGRALLALMVVGLALLPVDGRIQQAAKVPRIGVLQWEGCPGRNSVFGRALSDLGYTWGEKLEVVCRSAEGRYRGLSKAANKLVGQKVDVIVALSHIAAHAAHRAAQSIPIVMIASGDPVRTNLVASLARPSRNLTGLTYYSTELGEKRLQLVRHNAWLEHRHAYDADDQSATGITVRLRSVKSTLREGQPRCRFLLSKRKNLKPITHFGSVHWFAPRGDDPPPALRRPWHLAEYWGLTE